MGSKSRSDSRQTTNNSSTSIGVQGDNNGFLVNGSGNSFTTTDHGLVDALTSISHDVSTIGVESMRTAGDITLSAHDMATDVTRNGFDFASNVNSDSLNFAVDTMGGALSFGQDALDFGRSAMDGMAGLATDSIDAQSALARDAIAENGALANSLMGYTSEANARLSDLAMYSVDAADNSNARMSDVAVYSMDNASNLARDLGAQVIDATQEAYNQLGDRSALATKQALQFANDMSRSDGQQLAISTNKTMMNIVLGLAGLGIAVALITTRAK